MNPEHQIISWLLLDEMRMEALSRAATLGLKDWCLAAGFVRNLVWDKLHGYDHSTALNDIDLIYFDADCRDGERDLAIENHLKSCSTLPWSIKNQARMHRRNQDKPYASTCDAMMHWVELETAVGARLLSSGRVELLAPFGVDVLFNYTITLNRYRPKPMAFKARLSSKKWLKYWPNLTVVDAV